MDRILASLTMLLVASLALSGCLGDDETPTEETEETKAADEAVATAETGSIKGKVVSTSIEELAGVVVLAIKGESLNDTETDSQGRYTLNGLEPGRYTLQFNKPGYKETTKVADVTANTIVEANAQMPELTAADLGAAYSVPDQYTGFLSCGAGVGLDGIGYFTTSPCGLGVAGMSADPNDKFHHTFTVGEGLKEVVVGMTWDPVGGASGKELQVALERDGCGTTCANDGGRYGVAAGAPDLVFSVKDTDVADSELSFDNISADGRTLQFRVFPKGTTPPTLIYQQPYTVYWEAFYNDYAPDGYDPIPDQ